MGRGKGANWGQPQGDRDLKLPLWWAGEEWAHLEMEGEIAMGENGWGKGGRMGKLEMGAFKIEDSVQRELSVN
ncbi:uncharacterized protein Gasu_63610 [Galdieria sulphuraria]|uniref:Uncharacterized protein n=1 Tax=Galdieria sulphuraria TaxID=130081 RepID=M2VS87_GALSU|nr:uncharacterized protein Gasu_63610 [Galdieria sulphuraria]EME25981.1 hypothetical protein Gasu_63610 [Galdieria sulphuraria]|eukprot:XP_005702501.1 hypothetical protein Gasu_63610 [Galdieria sulphuraria]